MNRIIRKIRRWKYQHRCDACGRRYMWTHAKCPNFPKTIEAAQDELNAARSARVDKISCCENCTEIDKEIAHGQSQK